MTRKKLTDEEIKKQIILACKGWFNKVTDESPLEVVRQILSVRGGCPVQVIRDMFVLNWLVEILEDISSLTFIITSISTDMMHIKSYETRDYTLKDLIDLAISLILCVDTNSFPYELPDPDYEYFNQVKEKKQVGGQDD